MLPRKESRRRSSDCVMVRAHASPTKKAEKSLNLCARVRREALPFLAFAEVGFFRLFLSRALARLRGVAFRRCGLLLPLLPLCRLGVVCPQCWRWVLLSPMVSLWVGVVSVLGVQAAAFLRFGRGRRRVFVWGCSSCCSSVLLFVLRAVGLAGAGWRFALAVRFALGLAGSPLAGLCLARGRWCPCFVPSFGWCRALCGCAFLALRFRCLSVALRSVWLGRRCCWVGVAFLLVRFPPFALVAGCGLSVLPLFLGVLAWSRSSGCGRCFRPLGGRAAQLGKERG